MLSRELLREQSDRARELLAARGIGPEALDSWLELDQKRRTSLVELEELKRRRNEASKEIGRIKQQGGDAAAQIEEVAQLKGRIGELAELVGGVETELAEVELGIPNLPHDTVPVGEDDSANRIERVVGEPRKFDFEPKAHWDLGPELGILDFERGAKIAGARFTVYFGAGARLERALINFMLDLHTTEHGYIETLPPFIVNSAALVGTGQLPKFAEDLFRLEGHDYYLVPTAEVPVTNLHGDETLEEAQLPRRYAAFTPCFRAEAGSYGKDVRGLIRQHQFNKVELVHVATPKTSYDELEILTGQRRKGAPAPRAPLPGGDTLDRRHGLRLRQDLRPRGLAPGTGDLPRDLLLLQLHRLPGPPRQHPLPPRGGRQGPLRPHLERLGPRSRPHPRSRARELPAGRRHHHHPQGSPPLHGRPRANYAQRRLKRPASVPAGAGGTPRSSYTEIRLPSKL